MFVRSEEGDRPLLTFHILAQLYQKSVDYDM